LGNFTYDVFVSYSRADTTHALEIDYFLCKNSLRTFFDRRSLIPGESWVLALERTINQARSAVILIGPHGLGNVQQYEQELLFIRQAQDPTFRLIPILLPDTVDPPAGFLRVLTWIDFTKASRIADDPVELERLLKAVRDDDFVATETSEAICPYRGLDAFREEDAALFYGRGSAEDPATPIGDLIRRVHNFPFVMIVGRSGSGKSSLVLAGLVPALRREPNRLWLVLSLRPGPQPLNALAELFRPRRDDEGPAEYELAISREVAALRSGDLNILEQIITRHLAQSEAGPERLLFHVDQWEELYAQGPSSEEPEQFALHRKDVDRFIDLVLNATKSPRVVLVGTVRADFYDSLIAHPKLQILLPKHQMILGLMPRSELERAIVEPAKRVGLGFDPPSLVQRILDETGEDEGMLPLLQYALRETWALRETTKLTAASYDRAGGVREAIRRTAERAFARLSLEHQRAAKQLFLRLVTPGEGQEDTRARAAMPVATDQRWIVEQFASPRTRLLVTGWDRSARPTVEVAHEALIRTWPRLREWIDGNREKLRARAAILQAKSDWEQNERRPDLLLASGFALERARVLLSSPGDVTIDDIQDYITKSSEREHGEIAEQAKRKREAREAELEQVRQQHARRYRKWSLWIGTTIVLMLLVFLGFVSSSVYRDATERAFDRRLNLYLRSLIAEVATPDEPPDRQFQSLGEPLFELLLSGWYWQVTRTDTDKPDGRASRSLWDKKLPKLEDQGLELTAAGIRVGYVDGPEGQSLRIVERPVDLGTEGKFLFSVAGDASEIFDETRAFDYYSALALTCAAIVLVITVSMIYRTDNRNFARRHYGAVDAK
jgi:hypothetical protein